MYVLNTHVHMDITQGPCLILQHFLPEGYSCVPTPPLTTLSQTLPCLSPKTSNNQGPALTQPLSLPQSQVHIGESFLPESSVTVLGKPEPAASD